MSPPARTVALLLNVAHAFDHLFLLIFATAVAAIADDFGFSRWEDLMPYGVGAFLMFGLGSLPAGKLGDSWGRRPMVGSSRVDLQACKLEYSIVSPK